MARKDLIGNQYARGRGYKQRDSEAAQRRLQEGADLGIEKLMAILQNPKSTHRDLIGASQVLLDRVYPKLTNADVNVAELPPIILRIEGGDDWPEQDAKVPMAIAERSKFSDGNGHGPEGDGA